MVSWIAVERRLLAIVSVASAVIVAAIFVTGIYYFKSLHIDQAAPSTYAGIIIFLVACVLVIGLSLYCIWVYDRLHRTFLLTVTLVFSIGLAVLSYSIYHMNTSLFEFVEVVWDELDGRKVRELEESFHCEGFDPNPPELEPPNSSSNCAIVIKNFINEKTQSVAIICGILFAPCAIAAIFACYLACKKQSSGAGFPIETGRELSDLQGTHPSLHEGLNADEENPSLF
jgi:energy-coupling factor transporter transmembrane protein EcfT